MLARFYWLKTGNLISVFLGNLSSVLTSVAHVLEQTRFFLSALEKLRRNSETQRVKIANQTRV